MVGGIGRFCLEYLGCVNLDGEANETTVMGLAVLVHKAP